LNATKDVATGVVFVGLVMGSLFPLHAQPPLFAAMLLRETIAGVIFSANGHAVSCQGMVMGVRDPWHTWRQRDIVSKP
jgi:hypothetical protein